MNSVRKKPSRAVTTRKKKGKKSAGKRRWVAIAAIIAAVGGILYYLITDIKPMTVVSFRESVPEGFPSIGLDVSHHQGDIDWKKLMTKSGFDTLIHFVYCKATEGNTHLDTKWFRNRGILNNMGIPNGAYHFFIPTDPPRPQAAHFLNIWKKRDIDLPPVLDVEREGFSDQDLIAKMQIWLTEVENKSGMRPVIYTSLDFYMKKFQHAFPDYKFWIAAYSQKPPCINDERIIHWQYSETGKLPGIGENVDLNVSKINY